MRVSLAQGASAKAGAEVVAGKVVGGIVVVVGAAVVEVDVVVVAVPLQATTMTKPTKEQALAPFQLTVPSSR
ncbi:MAG: hypothetical protein ACT4OP_00475 [Actinomycetota bacterium]